MRVGILILIFVILISSISALKITEFESNPFGGSSEKEWIELYNDENSDIDISGWEIYDGLSSPKKIFVVQNETIIRSKEYYVIELSSAKLNNGGDFITIYDFSGTKIDETETLKDSSWSLETWQLCDSWEFKLSTRGEENSCEEDEEPPEEETPEDPPEDEDEDERTAKEKKVVEEYQEIAEIREEETGPIELKMINLNPKVIKSENDNEKLNNNYALYGFVFFCVLIIVLFVLRRNKYKNEFR